MGMFSFGNNPQANTSTTGLFGANKPAFGAATNTNMFSFGKETQANPSTTGLFGANKPAFGAATNTSFPFHTDGIGIEIEGLIDLGPKWNYEYKFSPISHQDSTVKSNYLSKFFDTSNLLRKDEKLEKEKQKKIIIREWHQTRGPLENQSSDKYRTNSQQEHTIDKIHDSETSKENDDIKRLKLMVGSKETTNRHNKIKFHSTQLTFHVQFNNEFNSKELNTKPKKNLRVTSHFLPTEKEQVQKDHKNTRNRLQKNLSTIDHKVKDDPKIFDFTLHIFKENLKIFDNIMRTVQLDRIKRKIKSAKKNFIDEFKKFLSQNKNYKIKTMLGNQKIILNTIDTSNKILQRLGHRLSESMDGENYLKDNPIKKFQRDVDGQKVIEEMHACKKFGICRNREEYSDFIIEIIGLIIQANDSKVKQASDALTEVVKTTDFTKVIDKNVQNELRNFMKNIEVSAPHLHRAMFIILRNAMSNKNHPIVIMDPVDEKLAAKTTAFHNLIDILDKNIVKSPNSTEWDILKRKFKEWKDGFRADILNMFKTLIKQIKTAFDKMDSQTAKQVNENMKILVKPITQKPIQDKTARMGTKNLMS